MRQLILTILITILYACGGGSNKNLPPDSNSSPILNPDYSDLKPYLPNGPYADTLVRCVAIEDVSDSCTLHQLPTIGMDSLTPTIDDVMNHLVVSHEWMGDRMRDLLELMPADMLLLLRSTTAIVIDDDIRPAHFISSTGAIYIDPAFLWLTIEEKVTVNPQEDYRSNFGNDLQFKRLWRYTIDNQYAWRSFSLEDEEERTIEDTLISTSWLFYHELAHANDCMPPDQINNLNSSISYYNNQQRIARNGLCVQDRLTSTYPLSSSIWSGLARVLYHGDNSTAYQRSLTPEVVGLEFEQDIANDTYSYSSVWEDTAMAFEAILMKLNFNANRDMVIVPYYEEFSCEEALVKWGQRGRLGDPVIIARAELVLEEILPELDLTEFFLSQPMPTEIPLDISYCELDYSPYKAGKRETTESMRKRLSNFRDIK